MMMSYEEDTEKCVNCNKEIYFGAYMPRETYAYKSEHCGYFCSWSCMCKWRAKRYGRKYGI